MMYSSTSAYQSELNISECNVTGTEIKSSTSNIGGISGYLYQARVVSFNNCKVEDLNIARLREDKIVATNNIGGFIAGAYDPDRVLKINNCEVSGVNIDAPANNLSTFMGSNICGNISMSNNKVTSYINPNTKVEKKNKLVVYPSTSTCGGFVGNTNMAPVNFENIECSDIVVRPNSEDTSTSYNYNFGGLLGCQGDASGVTFNNIKVKNIDYSVKRSTNGQSIEGTCAGFIGVTRGNKTTNFSNIEIDNININTNSGKVAGFIGCINNGYEKRVVNIQNIGVNKFSADINNNMGGPNNISAFIGVNLASISNISNVDIDNINFSMSKSLQIFDSYSDNSYKNTSTMSGLIGYNSIDSEQDIENIRINNINMVSTVAETRESSLKVVNMAGIIAVSGNKNKPRISIDSVEINNILMNTDSERGSIGGIYGVQDGEENLSISNSQVNNITATGEYAVGGILGIGSANVDNCTVTNPILTGKEGVATREWTGVIYGVTTPAVGGAVGIAVEESNLNNITVTADLPEGETEPSTYGIFSDYIAAGLVGINSGMISNSKVENIVVKSTKETINIEETNPDEENEPLIAGKIVGPHANAIQVLSLQDFIDCVQTNVKVVCGSSD